MIQNQPNPILKLIVSVLGKVTEMEGETLLERQNVGVKIAKLKGVYKGRIKGTYTW